MFETEFYKREDGTQPVAEFLDGLDAKMRGKALRSLFILQEYGTKMREPYSKAMGDGLFELRIKFAGDITRIFYFFVVGNRIILTNGFVKKSVKTPRNQLELARKYKADYERRMRHE